MSCSSEFQSPFFAWRTRASSLMAVLMASLNGLYIASFPQKMGHHIICYEYRQIFLTTVTVPTSKKRLSGGARVVKHAPLARVQGEQHTFPNQAHTRMKWPIFAVFVSLSLLGPAPVVEGTKHQNGTTGV